MRTGREMFEPDLIAQLAAELQHSEQSRVQVEHFSKRFPGMTIADGYAVSRAWVALKLAQGRTVRGHNVGFQTVADHRRSFFVEVELLHQ